jgi:hypothetical protein
MATVKPSTPRYAKVGEVYCVFSDKYHKWCAYQIVAEAEKSVAIIPLDWHSDRKPQPEDLTHLRQLSMEAFSWSGLAKPFFVGGFVVPGDYDYVGIAPVPSLENIVTYSSWPSRFHLADFEYRWTTYPESERLRYKAAKSATQAVIVNGTELFVGTWRVFENITSALTNWRELDKLGQLTEIHCSGPRPGLLDYIGTRQLIGTLVWLRHQQNCIDLRGTRLRNVSVQVDTLETLYLNDEVEELILCGERASSLPLQIVHSLQGKNLTLQCNGTLENYELPLLSSLSLWQVKSLDFSLISQFYSNINDLSVRGAPGIATNMYALANLKQLVSLTINDIFGYSPQEFPGRETLPKLDWLRMSSLPAEAAKAIRKNFKGICSLRIVQARKPDWLEANLDNPFRDWDGREHIALRHAKAAADAYRKVCRELNTLTKETENRLEVIERIFSDFVAVFNKIEAKSAAIETIEREEVYEVFASLVNKLALSEEQRNYYFDCFDRWRDF